MKNIFRKYVIFRIICYTYYMYKIQNIFGYQKALIRTFHTSSNSKINFVLKNQFIKLRFKDFWYAKNNLSQKYILYL